MVAFKCMCNASGSLLFQSRQEKEYVGSDAKPFVSIKTSIVKFCSDSAGM